MKFTNLLDDILAHKSKIKVLRYLLSAKAGLTGRELARSIGIHHRTCHLALKELSGFGVVTMQQVGTASVYKINENNLLVKKILKPIFSTEKNFLSQAIFMLLKNVGVRVISAIVYGSVAVSSERATSDVDVLFLVASAKQRQKLIEKLEKKEYSFILQYGNMLSPLVLTRRGFYKRLKEKDRFILNILHKGKVIYGKTIQELLTKCQQDR